MGTGVVTVGENGVELARSGLDTAGATTIAMPLLPVGTHTLTVAYPGDSVTQPSQASLSLTVGQATPAVTVTAGKLPAYGDPVTITAVVGGAGGDAAPTGSVTFTESGHALGQAPIAAGGRAAITSPSSRAARPSHSARRPCRTRWARGPTCWSPPTARVARSGDRHPSRSPGPDPVARDDHKRGLRTGYAGRRRR